MILPPAESIQIVLPVITVLFLLLGFHRPIYGTIAYFIVLNTKLGDMYPALGAIRFELLSAVVATAAIFISGNVSAILPRASALNKPLWFLFGVGMLSVLLAIDTSVSWEVAGYDFVRMMVFYFMVVASVRDRSDLTKLAWAFVLVTGWVAYEPVTDKLAGINWRRAGGGDFTYARGSFGAATGHVALANTLTQALPIAYFMLRYETRRSRQLLLVAVIALLVAGVVFSKSRGGFVGMAVIGAGLAYFSPQRAKAAAFAGVGLVGLLAIGGGSYVDHMATMADGIHQGRSTYDRYLGLRHGIEMLIERPPMGVGLGCYAEARSEYFNYYFFSHNIYGELIGELGLASFFWFYWIYCIFRRTAELKSELARAGPSADHSFYVNMLNSVQLALAVRLILGNFTHGAFIWFWFLMAAMVVCIERILQEESLASEPESEASQHLDEAEAALSGEPPVPKALLK